MAVVVQGAGPVQAKPPDPRPLDVTTLLDLRFGIVVREGAGDGWISVGPTGGGPVTGGGLVALGGDNGPALFEVVGVPYGVFQISLPNRLLIDRQVTVTEFTSDPEWSGVLDAEGRATVRVGGRLGVGSQGKVGSPRTLFQIEVNYQ
ncbi:MAG: DUF4402 domain-containing protein [Deferrisomatales bacterium]|nr:DUF4402 domain-containing protein [Deferrisomatales bacterium]